MVKESQKIVAVDQDIPVIDMSLERSRVSMQIVKACETSFWFDSWSSLGCIIEKLGERGYIDLGIPKTATVGEVMAMQRRRHHRTGLLNQIEEEITKQRMCNIAGERDIALWKGEKDSYRNKFVTSETWRQIRNAKPEMEGYKGVWFSHSTPKYSFITWLVSKNRMATGDRMVLWNQHVNTSCSLCDEPMETRDHLFFVCTYSRKVWEDIAKPILQHRFSLDWKDILNYVCERDSDKTRNFIIKHVFQNTIHSVWGERNARRHGEQPSPVGKLVKMIDKNMRNKLSTIRLVNHGVDPDVISRLEQESINFFAKPVLEKKSVGSVVNRPFGYGLKNIGLKGDIGEVEYLLLHTNPLFLSQLSFGNDSTKFGSAVTCYVEAIKQLACEILDLTAEGLRLPPHTFSKLIRAVDSDSVLRLNHYPSSNQFLSGAKVSDMSVSLPRVGFGEHTDPQILTVLRSNRVGGLQVAFPDGRWVSVSPDPSTFCVNVGDLLQVMTNGRFLSVRHRAVTTGHASRLSMAYFAGPSVHAKIGPIPGIIPAAEQPRLYRTFTWADYKKFAYSLSLGDNRLDIFRSCVDEHDELGF
ncbi:Oxoglutarate/iron-dependent dioxygenase [Arabidopsis suecica]|uniref:Oxoglutarate/iron-dependent dioxygenase n=1 Tax=Arabidopsis suecica TaxID=45249 RepID=A0A8T2F838_ARASU|nr:Oxoglutarate/iron-dependent dioxygenase [Arabidopsis suecica]